MNNHCWRKFYECSCMTEGIMASNEYEDDIPLIDLAMFHHGLQNKLSLLERIRFAWKLLISGEPYADQVVLDRQVAKELGKDLVKWGDSKR